VGGLPIAIRNLIVGFGFPPFPALNYKKMETEDKFKSMSETDKEQIANEGYEEWVAEQEEQEYNKSR